MTKHKTEYPRILTIAGSDSSGGAGIQADLKTFQAMGAYGMSAITALTAQNTVEVKSIESVSINLLRDQIEAVLEDIGVDAIKIGMLFKAEAVSIVASLLQEIEVPIVLDPVMLAKSGDMLLDENAVEVMLKELLPLCTLVTPNIKEATKITGVEIRVETDMESAAKEILSLGAASVLIKGGHLEDEESAVDCLLIKDVYGAIYYHSPRIETTATHGTGCTLASAIAVYLARGSSLEDSVREAKAYLNAALKKGREFKIGKGSGPLFHAVTDW